MTHETTLAYLRQHQIEQRIRDLTQQSFIAEKILGGPARKPLTQAERDAVKAARDAALATLLEAIPQLDALTDPLARAVLDLHRREPNSGSWTCAGDEAEGFEAERPEWPCATVRVVAERFGIPMPAEGTWWIGARPADGSLDQAAPAT